MYLQARGKLFRISVQALQGLRNRLRLTDQYYLGRRMAREKLKRRRNCDGYAVVATHRIDRHDYRHDSNPNAKSGTIAMPTPRRGENPTRVRTFIA